jgi:hypothetical protein
LYTKGRDRLRGADVTIFGRRGAVTLSMKEMACTAMI